MQLENTGGTVMNVGGIRLDGLKNPLQELLEKQKEELQEQLPTEAKTVTDALSQQGAAAGGDKVEFSSRQILADASSSIMAGSFVKSGSAADNMSDYVQANMAAAQAAQSLAQSLRSTMASFLSEVGIRPEDAATQAGASMAVRKMANKKNGEAHERNLDEIQEKLEEKTEEAMAPTDANGNPIKVGAEGGEVSAQEIEIAPEPQAASADPAAALPENPQPEAAVPQTPSIDLIV